MRKVVVLFAVSVLMNNLMMLLIVWGMLNGVTGWVFMGSMGAALVSGWALSGALSALRAYILYRAVEAAAAAIGVIQTLKEEL